MDGKETTTTQPVLARRSEGSPYVCAKPWAEGCGVQCGDSGIVFVQGGKSYMTAFFEAFPKNPNTFIRGEGVTIFDAEEDAWNQLQKFSACTHPDFEKRGYTNGAGFCVQCGMFKSKAFEPWEPCRFCSKPTYYTQDNQGRWCCEECKHLIPEEDKTEIQKMIDKSRAWLNSQEDDNQ